MSEYVISEPILKTEDRYLNPWSWCGRSWCGQGGTNYIAPPWGLGQTCWYVCVTSDYSDQVFAAETPERAIEGAKEWIQIELGWIEIELERAWESGTPADVARSEEEQ